MSAARLSSFALIVALCIAQAAASKCPAGWNATMGACTNLNATLYQGVWYEQLRSKTFIWDDGCYCTTARYAVNTLPAYVGVFNDCNKGAPGGNQTSFEGKAAPIDDQNCGLAVAFFGPPGHTVNYQVLDTDYTSYSIVITCNPIQHVLDLEQIWVLSRVPVMDPSLLATLNTRLQNWGFDFSDQVATVQGQGCTGQGYSGSSSSGSGSN